MLKTGGKCTALALPPERSLPTCSTGLSSGAASQPLCVWPAGTSHATQPRAVSREAKDQRSGPIKRRTCRALRAGATSRATNEAEGAQKADRVPGASSIPGNRLHGCPGRPQKVAGLRFPGPEASVVACDSGYAHWRHGAQGGSCPEQPTPVWASSDAWDVLPYIKQKSPAL